MIEIKPEWHFWDNSQGGYFENSECPLGHNECASYVPCPCSEEKRKSGIGHGWQCEYLIGNGTSFKCKHGDEQDEQRNEQ